MLLPRALFVLSLIIFICVPGRAFSKINGLSHNKKPNSKEAVGGNSNDKERNGKGVQFMITQKMRRTLEHDLRYTIEEVDEMEPQIAAVVIEKMLVRPSTGMPASWRRPKSFSVKYSPFKGIFLFAEKISKALKACINKCKDTLSNPTNQPYIRMFGITMLLWFNRQYIISASAIGWQVAKDSFNKYCNTGAETNNYQSTLPRSSSAFSFSSTKRPLSTKTQSSSPIISSMGRRRGFFGFLGRSSNGGSSSNSVSSPYKWGTSSQAAAKTTRQKDTGITMDDNRVDLISLSDMQSNSLWQRSQLYWTVMRNKICN